MQSFRAEGYGRMEGACFIDHLLPVGQRLTKYGNTIALLTNPVLRSKLVQHCRRAAIDRDLTHSSEITTTAS
jgi:hypothetical protein